MLRLIKWLIWGSTECKQAKPGLTVTLPNGTKVEGVRHINFRRRQGNAVQHFRSRSVQGNAKRAA